MKKTDEKDRTNQQAVDQVLEHLPPQGTGSVTLHYHEGVIKKLDWRRVETVLSHHTGDD